MSQDQSVNYRVNIDDSDFQSKLTQMRSSIDMTLGGMGGVGGYGMGMGGSMPMLGMMGNVMSGSGGAGMMSGMADFGGMIRPVSYMPPAMAMQPHFGMVQVQQTLAQAGLGMTGPIGMGLAHPFRFGESVPSNISVSEYMGLSTRSFGARLGDAASTAGLVGASTAASLVGGGIGSAAGSALFSGGVGKFVGGFLGGAVGGMAVTAYTGEVADMMAQNRAVQQTLAQGSFRFISGGPDVDPLTGRGFSRGARANIADFVQSQEIKDVRFGMPEMRQVLESGMQMDIFSGTKGVEDFKQKFKDLVDNVKTISSTLHTSMQEAVEVTRGLRDMGVTSPGQVGQMVMGAETMGRMSGRTGMEMMQVGQAGAEIFRGTGVSMSKGFELNQMNATLVRQMLNQGTISREVVGQAGGELALAQQMTAGSLSGFQTALGRGALLANMDPSTGRLNPNMLDNMIGSRDAMSMMAGAAGRVANNPMAMFRFQAHQAEEIGKLAPMQMEMFGVDVGIKEAKTMLNALNQPLSRDNLLDMFKARGLQEGKSEQLLNAQISLLSTDTTKLAQDQKAAEQSMRTQVNMEDFRNRVSGKGITNWMKGTFVQPVQQTFTGLSGMIEQGVTDLGMAFQGRNFTDSSGVADLGMARAQQILGSPGGAPDVNFASDTRGSLYQQVLTGFGFRADTGAALGNLFNTYGVVNGKSVSFNGATAHMFASPDAAIAAGMSVIGTHGKDTLAIKTSEAGRVSDIARFFQTTAADEKAADDEIKKSGLSTKTMNDLFDLSDKGVHVTSGDIVNTIMKDRRGGKWTGSDKDLSTLTGTDKAIIGRLAQTDPRLAKLWGATTNTEAVAGFAGKSISEISRSAASSKSAMDDLLYAHKFTQTAGVNAARSFNAKASEGGDSGELMIGQLLESGATENAIRSSLINSKYATPVEAQAIAHKVSSMSKADQLKYIQSEKMDAAAITAEKKLGESVTGGTSAAPVGDASKNTLDQFAAFVDSNKKTLEIMLRMQAELDHSLKKKGF